MCRIGDAWMVQAGDEIAELPLPLDLRLKRQSAPAINPLMGQLITVIYGARGSRNFDRADGTRDMAHVIASNEIVVVADTTGMNIPARQHQACDFKATRREYEIPGARREMSAIERIDVE